MTMQWRDIVAKGNNLKIPTNRSRRDDRPTTEPTTIFEVEDLSGLMKVHRAEAMLEMALHDDCVLFEFPTIEFPVPTDSYRIISQQIGRMVGGRTITSPPNRSNGKFMVEVKFATVQDTDKAINEGIILGGLQYRAVYTRANRSELPKMVRVHVSGVPFEEENVLATKLLTSMKHYGKICQIKMWRLAGVFEGAITVLLDTNEEHGAVEPLQRMLYMQDWDIYLPATFKGAPPVCYHCRQSRHLKKDCQVLASLKCYGCNGTGHIARHCRNNIIHSLEKRKFDKI
ncbi:hypothetical protein BC941DRAFT_259914, partial [Chlamydoabsidia padenii]